MNNVNQTLYIPLYGKAYVSRKGIILNDSKAEHIWEKEGFALKGKSKSKWLAYYMGMRSAVFDRWLKKELEKVDDCAVLHIGCGMDSRVERVGVHNSQWYDVDFEDVIAERKKYYKETAIYHMLPADARKTEWVHTINAKNAVVVLEGISMYFTLEEMQRLLKAINEHFEMVKLMMDCYTVHAAKASKYKNPINEVGVTEVYGIDEPRIFEDNTGLTFLREHAMTPPDLIQNLKGFERFLFRHVFAGKIAKGMYRMYEYESRPM